MFCRVQSRHYSSYLQIWFIESILNTAGAAKSPIYRKHLISSGSERLELVFNAPKLVASFTVQGHPRRLMPLLRQWTIHMYLCCSSRCHLLWADSPQKDADIVWLHDWLDVWGCRWGKWVEVMKGYGDLSDSKEKQNTSRNRFCS